MAFPPHIDRVLDAYAIRPDTKAALYELYVAMGSEVLEVFADLAEGVTAASTLEPDDTLMIRATVFERYLRRNHPRWLEGTPTPSLWHPRAAEGRASGAAIPAGELPERVRRVVAEDQPLPDGILIVGRNAHAGGRAETISFDVVPRDLDHAIAVAHAAGRQHTIPGSVGATTGTYDSGVNVALLWEVQPNVYKPSGERNQAIAKIYRRHRNWHLLTLAAAIDWLHSHGATAFIIRGAALAPAHAEDPQKPLSATIAELHDRTVGRVTAALDLATTAPTAAESEILLASCVFNHALRRHVVANGAATALWKVMIASP